MSSVISSTNNRSLSGVLSEQRHLTGNLTIGSGGGNHDIYDGEYGVIPSTKKDIILETKNLILNENIVIEKIPYIETSNLANGKTIYIGRKE